MKTNDILHSNRSRDLSHVEPNSFPRLPYINGPQAAEIQAQFPILSKTASKNTPTLPFCRVFIGIDLDAIS